MEIKRDRGGRKNVFALTIDELLEKDGILVSCPFSQNENSCGNWCPFFEIQKDSEDKKRGRRKILFNCNNSIKGTYFVRASIFRKRGTKDEEEVIDLRGDKDLRG